MTPGDHVAWMWGSGVVEGTMKSIHHGLTTIMSKDKLIKRSATIDNPAITIDHASGSKVLKLASEIQKTGNVRV